jgi:spermidine synthase
LGLRATTLAGVCLNLVVAGLAFVLSRGARPLPEESRPGAAGMTPHAGGLSRRPIPRPLLALTSGIFGFAALAFEILWTRSLSLSLGTTTYAFAVVLAVFLFGIASGSAAAGRLLKASRAPASVFGVQPAIVGILALLLIPVFDRLPRLFVLLSASSSGTWLEGVLVEALLAAAVLLPPTFVSGAALPLAVGLDRGQASHRSAGDIFAANTLGAILGSWAAGFVLLPGLGLRGSIQAIALLCVGASCLLALTTGIFGARARGGVLALAGLALALAIFLPEWDRAALTRGAFARGSELTRSGEEGVEEESSEIVFHEEGTTTTVTVRRDQTEYTMQLNGVTEASTSGDLSTQISVASLPLLLHESPRDALVIGLGGGITAAAALRFPAIESVECVEISEEVIHANRFFEDANGHVLEDPRMRLVVGDGRNHVRLSPRTYDAIISLPSHVWNAGIGSLMTVEFYRACREKLRAGGLLSSWIQGYSLSPDALRSVLAAVLESFPNVTLWRGAWGDLLIVASGETFTIDVKRLLEKGRDAEIGAVLRESGFPDLASLLSLNLLAAEELRRYVGGFPPNTDDRPYVEFETPKLLYEDTMGELFGSLYASAGGTERILSSAPAELLAQLGRFRRARAAESEGRLALREREGEAGVQLLEEAFSLLPGGPSIRRTLAEILNGRAIHSAADGNATEAASTMLRAIEVDPSYSESYANLAAIYLDAGNAATAIEAAREAVSRSPGRPAHHALLARALARTRALEEAEREATRALELDPRAEDAHLVLGDILSDRGERARAESVWAAGLTLAPTSEELGARLAKARR